MLSQRCFSCKDGLTAYEQIEANLGIASIESPDYQRNRVPCHPGFTHINCVPKPSWAHGDVFQFDLHLDTGCDPVKGAVGKQRNEIKANDKSDDSLKGFYGQTMKYTWAFQVNNTMMVSKKFTHIFQAKFVGGDSQKPAVTFTGATKKGVDMLEVRTSPASDAAVRVLGSVPWSAIKGQWVQATVEMTVLPIDEGGRLKVHIAKVDTGESVLSLDRAAGLWRKGNEFIRPKWGIYRQSEHRLIQPGDLNDAQVNFADFCISRLA